MKIEKLVNVLGELNNNEPPPYPLSENIGENIGDYYMRFNAPYLVSRPKGLPYFKGLSLPYYLVLDGDDRILALLENEIIAFVPDNEGYDDHYVRFISESQVEETMNILGQVYGTDYKVRTIDEED